MKQDDHPCLACGKPTAINLFDGSHCCDNKNCGFRWSIYCLGYNAAPTVRYRWPGENWPGEKWQEVPPYILLIAKDVPL